MECRNYDAHNLSLMIINATGEHSFSNLKLILNEKRTCVKQEKLNYLSLMSIGSGLLKQVEFHDDIKTFVEMKSRKLIFDGCYAKCTVVYILGVRVFESLIEYLAQGLGLLNPAQPRNRIVSIFMGLVLIEPYTNIPD